MKTAGAAKRAFSCESSSDTVYTPLMDTLLMNACTLFAGILAGYAATVHADYLIHRNIWHGRWRVVRMRPFRWLLYPHYVHHWRAHHLHAARNRRELEDGIVVPDAAHRQVEALHRHEWNVHHGLRCTEHGITIHGVGCICHYLTVFWFTPQPYVALLIWNLLGPLAGIPAMLMPLCAVTTQISHRYYHMSGAARAGLTPTWLNRVFLSREFTRLADEHREHHYDPAYSDDYYGVVPFGNRLLRPILGKN